MAVLVHLHSAQERYLEDERVRMIAKRAVAQPDFPFDGLQLGAAIVLAQLELSAGIPKAGMKPSAGK
jgi:hypothetical protein